MKKLLLSAVLAAVSVGAACGSKSGSATGTKTDSAATENKTTASTATSGAASAVVREVYDEAMRRNCSGIPAKLTDSFRKGVGTSKDELEALCDTFTDGGKLASFEIKGEELKGDSGTVKVALTYKDGKKEDKTENVKKSGDGRWQMDS